MTDRDHVETLKAAAEAIESKALAKAQRIVQIRFPGVTTLLKFALRCPRTRDLEGILIPTSPFLPRFTAMRVWIIPLDWLRE